MFWRRTRPTPGRTPPALARASSRATASAAALAAAPPRRPRRVSDEARSERSTRSRSRGAFMTLPPVTLHACERRTARVAAAATMRPGFEVARRGAAAEADPVFGPLIGIAADRGDPS